jgi:tetratricopeptide (TPR) repeat protein
MGAGRWGESRLLLIVAALALLASAPTMLAALKVTNGWAIGGTAVGAAVLIAVAAVWQERFKRAARRGDEQALSLEMGCLVLPDGQLPKVRQVTDPVLLGVHPSMPIRVDAAASTGGPVVERIPEYVRRDVDGELQERVEMGGFVVLVGDSAAGKSRAAYEAIAALRDHVLIVPQNREALGAAIIKAAGARRCVLWLDDLENYLGAEGLTRANIGRVRSGRRSHRVIMATLRAAEEARIASEAAADERGRQSRRGAREVLEQGHRISLKRMFSPSEQERAQANAWDLRIASALAHANEYGVAEYLAAGPELMRDWENAWSPNTELNAPTHPRAAALIAAAIDIRRSGYTSPLPRSLLEQVHDHYLRQRGGSRLRPESLADAWAWASRPQRATTALLEHVGDQHVQVFDYLLDAVQRRSAPDDHAPDRILEAAVAVSTPADAENIGRTAYHHARYHLAEIAWSAAYRAHAKDLGPGHLDTLASLSSHANMLRELGRYAETATEHQAIVDLGTRIYGPKHSVVLHSRSGRAFALIHLGRLEEAEEELRTVRDIASHALGSEHHITINSRHLRAITLRRLGRLSEAEAENRIVLNAWTRDYGPEDISTLYSQGNLAHVLYDSGQLEEARKEAQAVLDIRTRVLGVQHPDTLYARSLVARLWPNSEAGEAEGGPTFRHSA